MRFIAALFLLWQSALLSAFTVVPQTKYNHVYQQQLQRLTTTNSDACRGGGVQPCEMLLFMAGGDESDEVVEDDVKRTSFSDAGNALIDEEDDERMEAMGDFDSNPAVSFTEKRR